MRRPVLVAVGLLAAAMLVPSPAWACSFALPAPFSSVSWLDDGRIVANEGFDVGLASGATLERWADVFPAFEWGHDPGGRWLVYAAGARDPRRDASSAACQFTWGRTTAVDIASGERTLLLTSAAAIAASPGGVLTAHPERGLVRYAYGAWDAPQTVRGQAVDLPLADLDAVALSPDGSRAVLTFLDAPHVAVVALERGETVAVEGVGRFQTAGVPAWSPDGRHVALLPHRLGRATLVVVDASAGEAVTSRPMGDDEPGWPRARPAWGPEGLAVATGTRVVLYRDPVGLRDAIERGDVGRLLGSAAWSADGARLAVGGATARDDGLPEEGHVLVLDAGLRTLETRPAPVEIVNATAYEPNPPWTEGVAQGSGRDGAPGAGVAGVLAAVGAAFAASRRATRR